jgi:ribosomal protein S18 acetylase RimI-like enzyme
MVQRGKGVKTRVRQFKIDDLDKVLAIAGRYASRDATLTRAEIEEFHSGSPEFFFVAEAEKKILGFVHGRASNPPAKPSINGNLGKSRQLRRLP